MTYFKICWAYDFSCSLSLEEIGVIFNDHGPWQWQEKDRYVYGSYLNTRPTRDLHFRVHEYPQAFLKRGEEEGFSALLQIDAGSLHQRQQIDQVFQTLLHQIRAVDIREVEPYD